MNPHPQTQNEIVPIENLLDSLNFSETKNVQPIEHMPCYTWKNEQEWMDTQGNEHDKFPDYNNS